MYKTKTLLLEYMRVNKKKIHIDYDIIQENAKKRYSSAEHITRIFAIGKKTEDRTGEDMSGLLPAASSSMLVAPRASTDHIFIAPIRCALFVICTVAIIVLVIMTHNGAYMPLNKHAQ